MDKYPEYPKDSDNTISVRGMTRAIKQTRQLLPPVMEAVNEIDETILPDDAVVDVTENTA